MKTRLIGILNYTPDSFSDGGEFFSVDSTLSRIDTLLEQGADLVDIGASSTGYGAVLLTAEEELLRLKPLLECIKSFDKISIDTIHYETAKKLIDLGLGCVNDVSGGKDEKMIDLIAANSHVKYIILFSLVLPANKNIRISNIEEILDWSE